MSPQPWDPDAALSLGYPNGRTHGAAERVSLDRDSPPLAGESLIDWQRRRTFEREHERQRMVEALGAARVALSCPDPLTRSARLGAYRIVSDALDGKPCRVEAERDRLRRWLDCFRRAETRPELLRMVDDAERGDEPPGAF